MSPSRIVRNSKFQGEVEQFLSIEKTHKLSAFLNAKNFTIGETSVQYHILSHWEDMGLFREERPGGWRRFSYLDILRLMFLEKLRTFGVPIKILKKVYHEIENQAVTHPKTKRTVTFFEYYCVVVMTHRRPVYILVYEDGNIEIVDSEQHAANFAMLADRHHVHVSLNAVLEVIFKGQDFSPIHGQKRLSPEEMEVFIALRTGNYDTVTIKRRNGKIETIEAEETLDNKKRIIDILNESDFQVITIKQADGKTVNIKRKIRRVLKK